MAYKEDFNNTSKKQLDTATVFIFLGLFFVMAPYNSSLVGTASWKRAPVGWSHFFIHLLFMYQIQCKYFMIVKRRIPDCMYCMSRQCVVTNVYKSVTQKNYVYVKTKTSHIMFPSCFRQYTG